MNSTAFRSRIWIVGLGRVGTLMARICAQQGWLAGITVRSEESTERARKLFPSVEVLQQSAPASCENLIVALAVPDRLIPAFTKEWSQYKPAGIVHFSGALGCGALGVSASESSVAALHPLISVSSRELSPEIARNAVFGFTGNGQAGEAARALVEAAGGRLVEVPEESRSSWHLAATLASNGVYALLQVASQIAVQAGIDSASLASGLASLAQQSAQSAMQQGVVAATTGPVVRGDLSTVHKHLELLRFEPDQRALYLACARALSQIAEARGLSDAQLHALEVVLASSSEQTPL